MWRSNWKWTRNKEKKCRYCKEIFCDDCYYNYLKESIIRGKPNVTCPNCIHILKEGKIIQKLYETCNEYKSETPKLIKVYLLLRPKNISEAVYFLSKEDNLYQHIFYPSKLNIIVKYVKEKKKSIFLFLLIYKILYQI